MKKCGIYLQERWIPFSEICTNVAICAQGDVLSRQSPSGRSDLVCEPTTAADCLPSPFMPPRHFKEAPEKGQGPSVQCTGLGVKHPPTLLPSHTEAQISAAGVPSPYLSPAWPCTSLYLQFYRRNAKSLLEKTASSGCSETGNKNACD